MKLEPVYLVIGCPGSGKSWVCDQLQDDFHYVHHDLYIDMTGPVYVAEIIKAAVSADKPVLAEAPFSVSQTKDPLETMGIEVVPVFISEEPHIISERYQARENKPIPRGHLTRQNTYAQRAQNWGAFSGTSAEVLAHLKDEARKRKDPWGLESNHRKAANE